MYSIEKKRPPKKKKLEQEEQQKKLDDPMYAIFGEEYFKRLEKPKIISN
mgnify:CR=1 FL=1